jgi:hypothetical protein
MVSDRSRFWPSPSCSDTSWPLASPWTPRCRGGEAGGGRRIEEEEEGRRGGWHEKKKEERKERQVIKNKHGSSHTVLEGPLESEWNSV